MSYKIIANCYFIVVEDKSGKSAEEDEEEGDVLDALTCRDTNKKYRPFRDGRNVEDDRRSTYTSSTMASTIAPDVIKQRVKVQTPLPYVLTMPVLTKRTRQVYNLFQDPWNRVSECKVPLVLELIR